MKIKELYTDRSKWIQRSLSQNKDGEFVFPDSKDAECWCLFGAIEKCYPDNEEHDECLIRVRKEIAAYSINVWNDAPERTFQEVKALVEELDI